jgi:DNA-binding protein HU-beta
MIPPFRPCLVAVQTDGERTMPQPQELKRPGISDPACKKCLFFRTNRDSVIVQWKPATASRFTMAARKAPAVAKSAAKKPKAASAKGGAQATVTLKHLAASLSESHDVPKRQCDAMLSDMVGLVARHLKRGDKIRINGLGVLQVRKRAARMGRNPATGEAIKIKASKKVAFRVAKELKETV